MSGPRAEGYSLVELLISMAILSVVFALGIFYWQGRVAENGLRYGTFQVASDLRQTQEQAKGERYQYTVTFTGAAPSYTITRIDGGYNSTAKFPSGVTTPTNTVVTFDAFGRPDAAHTLTIQNTVGTATVSVNATGGITYQLP